MAPAHPPCSSRTFAALLWVAGAVSCTTSDKQIGVYNNPPAVVIVSPTNYATFDEGQTITFEAQVQDDIDGDDALQVQWYGQPYGEFPGPHLVSGGLARLSTANLEGGFNHVIGIRVIDSSGESASSEVTVVLNDVPEAPEIEVVRPTGGETAYEGADYEFIAVVADPTDSADLLMVSFSSDIDGLFCEPEPDSLGQARCTSQLSRGTHLLTFTVEDTEGFRVEATASFVIRGRDNDNDGFEAVELGGTDCDDDDNGIYPGAEEVCDDRDQDCDGIVDEDTSCSDDDGDGFDESQGDCDDSSASIYPGAPELPDGEDNDCDGVVDEGTEFGDDDGDGYSEADGDCNDSNAAVNPSATEICDSIDNDCDTSTDEPGSDGCSTYYYDYDGDGFGTTSSSCLCAPSGYYTSAYNTDCYDLNADANPAATGWHSSSRGDANYDFNCDGVQEKQDYTLGSCSWDFFGICSMASSGWEDGSAASCGTTEKYISSDSNCSSCGFLWTDCCEAGSNVTQSCR